MFLNVFLNDSKTLLFFKKYYKIKYNYKPNAKNVCVYIIIPHNQMSLEKTLAYIPNDKIIMK